MSVPPQPLNADELTATQPPPIRWLWDECLAGGMLSLLTSRWKAGKTTLISLLLARLGAGGTFAGSAVRAGRAVILSEEPAVLWTDRHARLKFDPGVRFLCRPFHGRPTPGEWTDLIVGLAADAPDLVVFDPMAMFLPGDVENHAAALLQTLEPLHRLTDAGSAVLLVHHPKKGAAHAEMTPRGTGALSGFVDILIDLDRPSGDSDRVRRLKVASRVCGSMSRRIELAADGSDYAVLPTIPDATAYDAGWPILKMVFEDCDSRPTRGHLLAGWPEDFDKPLSIAF